MRTKEGILATEDNRPDEMLTDWAVGKIAAALRAMDVYAREMAIGFEAWQRQNERDGGERYTMMRGKTPEQLYDMYLKEIEK